MKETKMNVRRLVWGSLCGVTLATYIGLGIAKGLVVDRELEPLRDRFAHVANGKFSLEYDEGWTPMTNGDFPEYSAGLNYGGRLDDVVEERTKLLRKGGCVLLGGWTARSNDAKYAYVDTGGVVFCYNTQRAMENEH